MSLNLEQLELLQDQMNTAQKATNEITNRFTVTLAKLAADEEMYDDFCAGIPELPLMMGCLVGLNTQLQGIQALLLYHQEQMTKHMQTVVDTVNDAVSGRI